MNVLDIFSGIGAFSLGLERAGMRTIAFCESDEFCRRVLRKHWPAVPCYSDVRELTADRLRADGIGLVDVVCGGWPCTDLSVAGRGAGLDGEQSGLWTEFARILGDVRPRFAIMENVAVLVARGLDRVLGDLAALGFDAEWHCIPASAVGAPHRRDRIWIIADARGDALRDQPGRQGGTGRAGATQPGNDGEPSPMADAEVGDQRAGLRADQPAGQRRGRSGNGGGAGDMADADVPRLAQRQEHQLLVQRATLERSSWWAIEPRVGRVAHGVPNRVDRLRSLGNALVPQIPEIIGRAIMAGEQ